MNRIVGVICHPGIYGLGGFCGGEGGYALERTDHMASINATELARIVLVAEGMGEGWENSSYRRDLERLFQNVFGAGDVRLDDDPSKP